MKQFWWYTERIRMVIEEAVRTRTNSTCKFLNTVSTLIYYPTNTTVSDKNMFAYNATRHSMSAVRLSSTSYLTSSTTSRPSSLTINKVPSPKLYRLKRSTAKRSSPRHDGEIFSILTICPPWRCPNFLMQFLAMKFSSISQTTILHMHVS